MDISGHILRRGVSTYLSQPRDDNNPPEGIVYQIPTWVVVMLATTVLGFFFVLLMVGGTLLPAMILQLTEFHRLTTHSDAWCLLSL
jgi:hypothetical protein